MIHQLIVIIKDGKTAYSRQFNDLKQDVDQKADMDLVPGFFNTIMSFLEEMKGGSFESMEFQEFKFLNSIDRTSKLKFIICIDKKDLVDEANERLETFKKEFLKRFAESIENWNGDQSTFTPINDFADEIFVIPPKIAFINEETLRKSAILELFPGESILTIDENLHEMIKKSIKVTGLNLLNTVDLWELSLAEILEDPKHYNPILIAADILILIIDVLNFQLDSAFNNYQKLIKYVENTESINILVNIHGSDDKNDIMDRISNKFDGIPVYSMETFEYSTNAKEQVFEILADILNRKYQNI